ncbi:Bax inhibitor-1/YccA family protein [Flavobacterium sp. J27]|uniref:Bax inhibitor-1/YccA family protein n=1 Tax=Flavobacterium sp. J27 TaxID=2060419 RepID=UPI001030E097|nr:Bax inhibitor-1/YccA family protein [Flavobacterium sp. J27]
MNLKSKNPFLGSKTFNNTSRSIEDTTVITYEDTMTVNGTINKSYILLATLLTSALISWFLAYMGYNPMLLTVGGGIVGFVLVLIASFKPQTSTWVAPGYALFEGLFIGGISAFFEAAYPGIVIQAVSCTFVTFIVCFALYKYQIVKVTEKFKSIVIAATLAIFSYYLITWILSFFINFQPIHAGNSLLSIGVSIFVIIIAALNLFLDFDLIEKGAQRQLPKYMEWFSAMGLMITLVWLYVEFLRLLAKLSSRD